MMRLYPAAGEIASPEADCSDQMMTDNNFSRIPEEPGHTVTATG
jgi:hypothetical protein